MISRPTPRLYPLENANISSRSPALCTKAIQDLEKYGLFPIHARDTSVKDIGRGLHEFDHPVFLPDEDTMLPAPSSGASGSPRCIWSDMESDNVNARSGRLHDRDTVRSLVRRIEAVCAGVCLGCLHDDKHCETDHADSVELVTRQERRRREVAADPYDSHEDRGGW